MRLRIALLTGLIFVTLNFVKAQVYPIEINLILSPPFPTNLDAYEAYLEQGIIQLTNTTGTAIEAFFQASFEEESGRVSVGTDGILGEPITINPGTTILTPMETQDLFAGVSNDNITINGLSSAEQQAILISRQIPEGNYRICLTAFDINGQPLSDPDKNACTELDITFPERPIIDIPQNEDEVLNSGFVNITWSHYLQDPQVLARTEYILKIIDLTEQSIENVELAFLDPAISPEYEEEQGNIKTAFLQDDVELPLITGHQYACRVTAFDPNEETSYQFAGHSEIVTFTYGLEGVGGEIDGPSIISPGEGDYLENQSGIALSWEHEIEDEDIENDTEYNLRVIDMDALKLTSVGQDDFFDDQEFIWDIPISATDTTLLGDADHTIVKDHQYAMAIIASRINDERVEFANDGYSNIVTFVYGEEPEEEEDGCGGECITALPTNQKEVPVKKGDVLFMGKFSLVIDQAVKDLTNGGYKGEGYVIVKFMAGIKVKVSFDGLKVNKQKYVFAGEAAAILDESLPKVDGLVAAGLAGSGALDFEKAKALSNALRSTGKLASALTGQVTTLPIGFDRDVDGDKMIVGVTEMTFTAEDAEMGALFSLENPEWGEYVPSFGANEICITQDGFGNGVKLYLAKDFNIPISETAPIILKSQDPEDENSLGTFVEIDCNGFKRGQITAEVPVPREVLVPDDGDGEVLAEGNATILLSGTFAKAGNFLLSASMKPCQIPGLEGFTFSMDNGYYDNSDLENPASIAFPQGYSRSEADETWKGIWFSNVQIQAPKDWMASSGDDRTTFAMENFIKDDVGISLKGSISNILSIDKGELEGFAISIDKLSLDIIRGQFKEVKMIGRMGLPILPEDNYLDYEGLVDRETMPEPSTGTAPNTTTKPGAANNSKDEQLAMSFTVKPNKDGYDIDWLKAHIDFEETSQFIIKNDSKERGVGAFLSGKLSIVGSIDKANANRDTGTPEIEIPGIKFEGMEISRMIPKEQSDAKPVAGAPKANSAKNSTGGFVFKKPTMSLVGFSLSSSETTIGSTTQTEDPANPANPENPNAEEKKEPTQAKLNAFSISIDEIGFSFGEGDDAEEKTIENGTKLSLTVVPNVALVGAPKPGKAEGTAAGAKAKKSEGFSISAAGKFTIGATVAKKPGSNGMTFEFESVKIDSFSVVSEVGPIGIEGSVGFYNADPEFGNGMVGKLAVEMPMVDIKLEARFGNTLQGNGDIDYAYWYLFASVLKTDPLGLVKIGPYFTLHGFKGGVYYHMRDKDPTATEAANRYTPTKDVSLGVKAGIMFAVTDAKVLWASTVFGIQFNADYGVDEISFEGDGYMMQPEMKEVAGSDIDGVKVEIDAKVNFKRLEGSEQQQITFDAHLGIFVNIAQGLIQGNMVGAAPYQMVKAHMYIGSDKFFMIMGKPSTPGSVQVGIPDLATVTATAYMMAGKDITFEEAVLPTFIQQLLGRKTDGLASQNAVSSKVSTRASDVGNGIAMGMNIDYKLELEASILYAKFRAMFGFDLMMRDYPGVTCINGDGAIGINGYYASGQVFAGMSGDIGLDIDLFFYTGKLSIASLQAVLLLEGGLPNPIWVRGTARMNYSVLGGMVEGSTGFTVQLGEQCEKQIVDPFAGVDMIADIDPGNISNVSVFAKPQVSLNAKLGEYEIPFVRPDGVRTTKKFRLKIATYTLKEGSRTISVRRNQETRTKILLEPYAMLNPQTYHTIDITLKADELVNGTWIPYKKDGSEWSVTDSRKFKTGNPPDHIVWENIKLTYPFKGESTYLHGENRFKEGFLQFGVPTNYLFESKTPSDQQWHSRVVVKWWKRRGYSGGRDLVAKTNLLTKKGNFLTFKMPTTLPLDTEIRMEVVREYYQNSGFDVTGKKIGAVTTASTNSNFSINVEGETYKNYSSDAPADKVLFGFNFETSKFNKFKDKVSGIYRTMSVSTEYNRITSTYGRELTYKLNTREEFSYEEIGKRRVMQSNTDNRGMIEVSENYYTSFYKEVFDFFEYERLVMAYMKDFTKPDVQNQLIAKGYQSVFLANIKWGQNKSVSIDSWNPISRSDRRKGFSSYFNLIGAKSNNNGEYYLYSDVLNWADVDLPRTSEYMLALLQILKSEYALPLLNNNARFNGGTRLRTIPPRGNYVVKMKYWTPRVENGRVKEYASPSISLTFKY